MRKMLSSAFGEKGVLKLLVLQHVESEHLGILADFFDADGIEYKYLRIYEGESAPKNSCGYSGLIILGGPAGVYEEDKYPFLRLEQELIRDGIRDWPLSLIHISEPTRPY